jgi:hypothetical protein
VRECALCNAHSLNHQLDEVNIMEEKKKNCWEFKECGREPGGRNVAALGVCAAATEERADGIHQGDNGGRACWAVTGSLCKIENSGITAREFSDCQQCTFYEMVRREEHPGFKVMTIVLNDIRKRPVAALAPA